MKPNTLLLITAIAVTSCSGGSSSQNTSNSLPAASGPSIADDQLAAVLPSIAELAGLEKTASLGPEDFIRNGSEVAGPEFMHNATIEGDNLRLSPNWDIEAEFPSYETAWAVYSFNLPDETGPATATAKWDGVPPVAGALYIAAANFTSGRWEFVQPASPSEMVEIGDYEELQSPLDRTYVGLIMIDKYEVQCDKLRLSGNYGPVVDLQASDTTGEGSLLVNFDASASFDLDGEIEKYEWAFEDPNHFSEFASGPTQSYNYFRYGEFICTVRAWDDEGSYTDASVGIVIDAVPGNSDPEAKLTAEPLTGLLPLHVYFDASGSTDDDGTVEYYFWDFDDDDYFESPSGKIGFIEYDFIQPGEQKVNVMAIDNQGAFGVTSVIISVLPVAGTEPPVASMTLAYSWIPVGQSSRLDASASTDPDNDIVNYSWDVDGDGVFEYDTGLSPLLEPTFTEVGYMPVTVRVTDSGGRQSTVEHIVWVLDLSGYAEVEPNDGPEDAFEIGGFMNYAHRARGLRGNLGFTIGENSDWYSFDATRKNEIRLDVGFVHSELDLDLRLYHSSDMDTPLAESVSDDDNESITIELPETGIYYLEAYVDEAALIPGPGDYELELNELIYPVASLVADPPSGTIPFDLTLDGSGSSSAVGYIIQWDFDFDGDGNYEILDYFSNKYFGVWIQTGTFDLGMRITNDIGLTDEVSVQVQGF